MKKVDAEWCEEVGAVTEKWREEGAKGENVSIKMDMNNTREQRHEVDEKWCVEN